MPKASTGRGGAPGGPERAGGAAGPAAGFESMPVSIDGGGNAIELVGGTARWRARSREQVAAVRLRREPLRLATVGDATVAGLRGMDGTTRHFSGGVVAGGAAVPDSLRWVQGHPLTPIAEEVVAAAVAERVGGTALYLGPLLGAFGHFLVETLARFWALDRVDLAGVDHVVVALQRRTPPGFALDVFQALGLAHKLRIVAKPERFDRVIVPEASHAVSGYIHPDFKAAAEAIAPKLAGPTPTERAAGLYFTRSRLDPWSITSAVVGEGRIEERLAAQGIAIVAPEEHPFAEQVRMVRATHRLGGIEGSALHMAMFAEAPLDLAVLCRRGAVVTAGAAIDAVRTGRSRYLGAEAAVEHPHLIPNAARVQGFPQMLEVGEALRLLALSGLGEAPAAGDAIPPSEADIRAFNALAVAALARDAVRQRRADVAEHVTEVRRRYPVAEDAALGRMIEEMEKAFARPSVRGWGKTRKAALHGLRLRRPRTLAGRIAAVLAGVPRWLLGLVAPGRAGQAARRSKRSRV
jgi:hypothetical protein